MNAARKRRPATGTDMDPGVTRPEVQSWMPAHAHRRAWSEPISDLPGSHRPAHYKTVARPTGPVTRSAFSTSDRQRSIANLHYSSKAMWEWSN